MPRQASIPGFVEKTFSRVNADSKIGHSQSGSVPEVSAAIRSPGHFTDPFQDPDQFPVAQSFYRIKAPCLREPDKGVHVPDSGFCEDLPDLRTESFVFLQISHYTMPFPFGVFTDHRSVFSGCHTAFFSISYKRANGTYAANCWEQVNGKWYNFDGNGIMRANQWVRNTNNEHLLSSASSRQ